MHSYKKAMSFVLSCESHATYQARLAIQTAETIPWVGKTAQIDKIVFISHADTAFRSGKDEYHLSSRELAMEAGISRQTATSATKRLIEAGLLLLVKPSVADKANTYRLNSNKIPLPQRGWGGNVTKLEFGGIYE
jgi:hypothetical protein